MRQRARLQRESSRVDLVIDIETAGTDPTTSDIIEIASVGMVRGGGITNPMDTLVRASNPIPLGASSAVHHIIDETFQRGQPVERP